MPSSPHTHIERELTDQLQRLEPPYRRALAAIEGERNHPDYGRRDMSECLDRLQPIMQQIQIAEGTLGPLRQRWMASQGRPGPELRTVLKRHEQLLQQLIREIDALEAQARDQRARLLPKVDTVVRHQQMQRAYQQRH